MEASRTIHPYGVQPTGNAFLVTDPLILQAKGNGLGILSKLADEAILEICGHLSAVELSRLSTVSRMCYVFAMTSDLWRDLSLALLRGGSVKFYSTWRDTYVNTVMHQRAHKEKNELVIRPHVPIRVKGAFSNVLYRMWACRNCDLNIAIPGFNSTNNVMRVHAKDLSASDFVNKFEKLNVPLVIEGAVDHWKVFERWTPEYLMKMCGDMKFRATAATAAMAATFTMSEYFQYAKDTTEEVPLYLFDRNFFDSVPTLAADIDVPPYFAAVNDAHHGTDLFRVLGAKRRPDYRWLIAGPARSGSVFHIDPNMTNAWNVCVTGRKKWIFYPPGNPPPGVVASDDGADVTVPLSTAEWLLSFWSEHEDAKKYWPDYAKPLETVVGPGDVIFVPHNYWHMVVNLDDCIAITQNYVSASNLSDVLRFLRDKEDQISGVRDRPQEAVQAEELYTEFIAKMRENRDNTYITDEHLDQCIADSFRPSDLETLDGSSGNGSGNSRKRTLTVNKKNRPRKKQTTTASSEDSKQSGRTDSPSNVALLVDSEGESSEESRQPESTSTSFSFSFSF
jgi:hypothetical protein